MKKTPLVIAALLVSATFFCLIFATTVWAGLTDAQKRELQKCTYTYDQCMKACPDQLSQSHNQIGECQQVCLNQYYDCRQKARIPGYVRGPGGLTEPTAPPNKSHPTPTPRKGPGTVSGLSNSHPPPTPTPSKKGQ
jgi:hypothetical protein